MESKPLIAGIIGFFLGGLLVSVAATTFEKDKLQNTNHAAASSLAGKKGDDFDKAFIEEMIQHHQGAIDMSELAEDRAEHSEIKQLSREIMAAQSREIELLQTWRADWGYKNVPRSHDSAPADH